MKHFLVIYTILIIGLTSFFSCDKSKIAENCDAETQSIVDSLIRNSNDLVGNDNELAELYTKQIIEKSNACGYQKGIAEYYFLRGKILFYNDSYSDAIVMFDSSLVFFEQIGDLQKVSDVYSSISRANAFLANFDEAILFCNKSAQIRRNLNNLSGLSDCYIFLGEIHKAQNNLPKTFYYLNEALQIKTEINDEFGLANLYRSLGNAYEIAEKTNKAFDCFQKAYQIDEKNGNLRTMAISKHYLGKICTKKEDFDLALKYFTESCDIFNQLNEKYGLTTVYISISEMFIAQNNFIEAKKHLIKAFNIADSIDNKQLQNSVSKKLANIYKNQKMFDSAFFYMEQSFSIYTEIFSFEREKMAQEMENKFQLITKNQEIIILQDENKHHKQQKIIILLIFAFIILLVITLISLLILRTKTLRQRNFILKKEKLLEEKERQILEDKIKNQNKELASKSLLLIRNNESLETVIEKLRTIEKYIIPEHKSKLSSVIREIESTTKENLWEEFETAFNNVHTEFFDSLLKTCPDLSPVEIKIAAFLRLNLSTKEIAAITYKSESSIKTARHRLRKKLNLPLEENLTTFLLKL